MHLSASVIMVAAAASLSQAWILQTHAPGDVSCSNRPQTALTGHGTSSCLRIEQVGNIKLEQLEGEDCFMEFYTAAQCTGRPATVIDAGQCKRNIEGSYKWLKVRTI